MSKEAMLKVALYYGKLDLRVFPLQPGKKVPATPHGCKDATSDPSQIRAWWGGPQLYNIGLATGGGLVVLDVDVDHDTGKYGDKTLVELERQHGPLPDTWTCLTGGGGTHYYFRCDDPGLTLAAGFAPGLDYRGAGGYVVVPPSIHESGREYVWEAAHTPANCVLAPLPDWLHTLMLESRKTAPTPQREVPGAITEGARNDTLYRLACSLRSKGMTEAGITAALLEENRGRCSPPLPDREVERIAKSAGKYPPGNAGCGYALGWNGSPATDPAPSGPVKPPDYSDAGNAVVFNRTYQNDLIFVDALGWLYWNGRRWERNDHHALALALDLSNRMLREALDRYGEAQRLQAETMTRFAETGDDEDKDAITDAKEAVKKAGAYLAHAKTSRNATRIKNMVELSKPALVLKADKLDANPLDLNTPAGIVNLTTGQLRPHDRTAYCSQITEASPRDTGREMWENFLNTTTCGDGSIQGFLQLVSGMALIGTVYQEGIVIACGGGRNGKSTFFNALGQVLGDYAGSIDIKTLTTDRGNKGASLATLRGKRLVVTGELEEHQRLSIATLKQVASTDKLTIEEKYKQPETVRQSHTLVLFTNHLPWVGSTDMGTWRRLLVIPFNAVIPPGKGVQNYAEVLAKEAGGAILSWAIEGAVNFVRNGFKLDIPDIVAETTEAYRQREDWLTNFINERCVREPNAREGARALYLEYKVWAEDAGEYIRRENDFAAAMEAAGIQRIQPKGKYYYVGLHIDQSITYRNPYNARFSGA